MSPSPSHVANFRSLNELREILKKVGFVETKAWMQMRDKGGVLQTIKLKDQFEIDLNMAEIVDAHLGYIVVAEKD